MGAAMIDRLVAALMAAGVPYRRVAAICQAFGGSA